MLLWLYVLRFRYGSKTNWSLNNLYVLSLLPHELCLLSLNSSLFHVFQTKLGDLLFLHRFLLLFFFLLIFSEWTCPTKLSETDDPMFTKLHRKTISLQTSFGDLIIIIIIIIIIRNGAKSRSTQNFVWGLNNNN
jgi:hypothetical protein